jgi:hypothetical protein
VRGWKAAMNYFTLAVAGPHACGQRRLGSFFAPDDLNKARCAPLSRVSAFAPMNALKNARP